MLLGFKAGLIFFLPHHSVFTGFHCPLCSNVDEWLHIDVCAHCQSCVSSHPAFVGVGRGVKYIFFPHRFF